MKLVGLLLLRLRAKAKAPSWSVKVICNRFPLESNSCTSTLGLGLPRVSVTTPAIPGSWLNRLVLVTDAKVVGTPEMLAEKV